MHPVPRVPLTAPSVLRVCAAVVCAALAITCNIFASLDRCESETDCPQGYTCDARGRFCLALADAATPDAGADSGDAGNDAPSDADAADAAPLLCDPLAPFETTSLVRGFETTPVYSARLAAN